jgi:hypothetical protein
MNACVRMWKDKMYGVLVEVNANGGIYLRNFCGEICITLKNVNPFWMRLKKSLKPPCRRLGFL